MSVNRSRDVMRLYLHDVLVEGRMDLLDELADADVVDHTAQRFGWRRGRDGWVDHVNHFRTALPDVAITVHRIVADDDNAVGCRNAQGTHSAEFFGVPATGRIITGDAVSFFTLKNGKVVDYQVVVDLYPILKQMAFFQTDHHGSAEL